MPPAVPPRLTELLQSPVWDPYRAAVLASLRSCWAVKLERVARLQAGFFDRIRGRSGELPKLPFEASKLGGVPYLESEEHWPRGRDGERVPFVGQINFSELPPLDAPGPRRGIFVLFCKDTEPYYAWQWYPEPDGAATYRAPATSRLAVAGPCAGRWEWRLSASPACTVSFASWYGDEHFLDTEDAVPLIEWAAGECGHVGAFTEATLRSPSPRDWLGPEPADGAAWLQIWNQQLEENFGSLTNSVVIRIEDFEAGRLDRCRVVVWQ